MKKNSLLSGFDRISAVRNFLVFLIVSIYVIVCMWPEVNAYYVERGDFAANSLLIMDAKDGSLLLGHYSRVGFNHPSPALLYLLSISEFLLYDKFSVVKSPFSAHLIFSGLFNAFWISVTVAVLTKHLKNFLIGTAVATTYLLAVNFFEPGSIVGPWFPHMYIFLYGALLVLMASFVSGNHKSYFLMVLSAFFLVGTNVSMAPQLVIMFALMVTWMSFTANGKKTLAMVLSKKNALATFGIFLIFFAPLLYLTIVYGYKNSPIHSYLAYGAGRKSQGIFDSFLYVANFWNGYTSVIFAACAIVLAWRNTSEFVQNIFGIVAFATFSFYIYSKFGVDDFQHRYLGLYYYSAVAMTLSIILYSALVFCTTLLKSSKAYFYLSIVMFIMSIALTLLQPRPIPGNVSLYNSSDGKPLFNYIKSFGSYRKIVIDVDLADDPSYVWGNFLGFLILAKRDRLENFCVRNNWHISYTKDYKCPDVVFNYETVTVSKKPVGSITNAGYDAGGLQARRARN